LIKDYNELRVGLQQIIYELDRHYGDDYEAPQGDNFERIMTSFRDTSVEKFDQLEVRYTSMDVAYKDVVSYFGENPGDMKPDEFFSIFKTFTSSWEVSDRLQAITILLNSHLCITNHRPRREPKVILTLSERNKRIWKRQNDTKNSVKNDSSRQDRVRKPLKL
jgi:cytokinesis protein